MEEIIKKLLNYLGDIYGMDYDDLKYSCKLTDYEISRCKEILEENNNEYEY